LSLSLFDLTGRRALITGAGRGIGLALAQGLARAGAEVVLNGRDLDRLDQAAASIRAEGLAARTLPFDVTDRAAVIAAIDGFEAEGNAIDILVNNAGIQHRAPLHDFPAEAWDRVIATNLTAVFTVAQAVARHMIPRGRGRIINIASLMSALARPTVAPYTATKGAVSNLTKGMAADWARLGLNCNAIGPGYIATEMNAALIADAEFSAWVGKRTPAGRWGRAEELQGACIFLASDAASYLNGQTIFVDGGMSVTV
jgi:gluconate 5-dehydrogenase